MLLNYSFKKVSVLCLTSILSLSSSLTLVAVSETSQGLPGRRVGGGSRGCQELQSLRVIDPKQLIALIPENNMSKTATDYPTLFFRIPTLPSPKRLEFALRDDRDQRVYKTTLKSPEMGGVLSMPLPAADMAPLAVGKSYHWYFSIICDANDRAKDITIEGNIERMQLAPAVTNQLKQVSPSEQVKLLLTNGLWQDALTTMATLRRDHPQDSAVAAQWTELLKAVALETIAKDTILSQSEPAKPVSIKP